MALSTKTRLSEVASRWPLLQHSFYQRWTQGTLTADELRCYSDQYRYLVVALPKWLDTAAASHPTRGAQLNEHAREESDHIAMWDGFRQAIGAEDPVAAPNAATSRVIGAGMALADHGLGAVAAWAIEAQAPEVSRAKADGLARHYGIDAGSGVAYFELHSLMDVDHARELEAAIDELPEALQGRAAEAADTILSGLWEVLSAAEWPGADPSAVHHEPIRA